MKKKKKKKKLRDPKKQEQQGWVFGRRDIITFFILLFN